MDGEQNPSKSNFLFSDVPSIAREILAYLEEHPDAQDSIEGIMQWWLLERSIHYQTSMVKKAVDVLVKEGLVIQKKLDDATLVYRLNVD